MDEMAPEQRIAPFFFNDTATTEIYTLSLHDALPISGDLVARHDGEPGPAGTVHDQGQPGDQHQRPQRDAGDRKSTRLNSSHANISYAVFCLKKKPPLPVNTLLELSPRFIVDLRPPTR